MGREQVLVFPAERLERYLPEFAGGVVSDPYLIEDIWDSVAGRPMSFADRAAAENDPSLKQLIPYCVLRSEWGGVEYFFAYRRTKKGGEGRLHEKWSVGIGGHINPCDDSGRDEGELPGVYAAALRREMLEEVSLTLGDDLSVQAPVRGLIYDSSDEVGRVHFGVVHVVNVREGTRLEYRDEALDQGKWYSLHTLRQHVLPRLENWSALVVNNVLR